MTLASLAIVILLCPIAAALLIGLVGPRGLRGQSHWLAILGVGAALLSAAALYRQVRAVPEADQARTFAAPHVVYAWMRPELDAARPAAGWFNVEFRIDPLTAIMLMTVLSVSLLVIIYSVGYMRDHHGHPERGYERFFAFLCLFVFSMCVLVLGGNFILLYVGWELVGLCSFLLIGFYYQRPSAAAAAKKAFLVNRVGDFGFALAILLVYRWCGDVGYAHVFSDAGLSQLEGRETLVALLLFCGAVGKSAQLPLHVWLPDAMEGPTPVSALIHAATMVTAGVYMVARCGAIFVASPLAMAVVASVGAVTALFAATIALTQFDMKRILAYSTISQLGYMFVGLGCHAADAAVYHLFTHAFFKALLFLGAGSVMHAMAGEIDLRRFSGLARSMRVTAVTFWIGGLALAGFPMLSGFFSKDEIIHAALTQSPLLGAVTLLTALLTAFYTFRMIFLAFHGAARRPANVEHVHESGPWMALPLVLLAVGAIFAGYVGFGHGGQPREWLASALPGAAESEVAHESGLPERTVMIVSASLAIVGIAAAWFVYRRRPAWPIAVAFMLPGPYQLLKNKYYIDELYDAAIVRPLRGLGRVCYGVDRYGINLLLFLITAVPRMLGFMLRGLQAGAMQGYALAMVVGLAAMMVLVLYTT
ncbi:MAG: NADH-quinone oxidoreductase subunit L [Phycisphaerae bacterium]